MVVMSVCFCHCLAAHSEIKLELCEFKSGALDSYS